MNRENVVELVIDAVRQVQESSGRYAGDIGPETRPLRDVEDFDSHNGVEATLFLSESLGKELPDSIFVPGEGNRILSINEIAEDVCKYMLTGSANR